jgi:hypothetical protein
MRSYVFATVKKCTSNIDAQAAVVIVGDAAEISEQVKAYSDTIKVYDTDGKPKAVKAN